MDPLKIVTRIVIGYVFMLILLRISGKRTVRHATPFEFVVSLIIGDLFDDLFWAEVSGATFMIAAGVLTLSHLALSTLTLTAARKTPS